MSDLAELRENSGLPLPVKFKGKTLANYAAGHRAILRGLTRKHPKVSLDIISWLMVYILTRTPEELLDLALDPTEAWLKVMEFANSHEPHDSTEALNAASEILERVESSLVSVVASDPELPKKNPTALGG